jgi:hypothetical protein
MKRHAIGTTARQTSERASPPSVRDANENLGPNLMAANVAKNAGTLNTRLRARSARGRRQRRAFNENCAAAAAAAAAHPMMNTNADTLE